MTAWRLVEATAPHHGLLAALHATCFPEESWDAAAIGEVLAIHSAFARLALEPSDAPVAFAIAFVVAETAELLSLGTLPQARRRGAAHALLDAVLAEARSRGARELALEVAEDNTAALALYAASGFIAVGRRRDYYKRSNGFAAALALKREL